MDKRESTNTNDRAAAISTTAGSLLGATVANATIRQITEPKAPIDEDIVVQHVESHDEVVVISHSNDNASENTIAQETHETVLTPEPQSSPVEVYPEPIFIIEDVYAGPIPEPEPIDPNVDPIICIYGPPEPDLFPDIDDPTENFIVFVIYNAIKSPSESRYMSLSRISAILY